MKACNGIFIKYFCFTKFGACLAGVSRVKLPKFVPLIFDVSPIRARFEDGKAAGSYEACLVVGWQSSNNFISCSFTSWLFIRFNVAC